MKKLEIIATELTAAIIVDALDLYVKLQIGATQEILQMVKEGIINPDYPFDDEDQQRIQEKLFELKGLLFNKLGRHSRLDLLSDKVGEPARVAQDALEVLRKALSDLHKPQLSEFVQLSSKTDLPEVNVR